MDQQHHLPRHRRRLRRRADRAALPRARDRLGPGRAGVVRAGASARADRPPTASRRCSGSTTSPAPAGWRPAHAGKVKIPEENAAAALEVMSRFAVDPRWLIYLPPTMSPVATSTPRRLPGAPGAGLRGVRRLGRHPRRVRGEAHGLAGHRGHRQGRRRRRAPVRHRRRQRGRRLHPHRPAVLRRHQRARRPAPRDRGSAVRVARHRLARPRLRAAAVVGEGARPDQGRSTPRSARPPDTSCPRRSRSWSRQQRAGSTWRAWRRGPSGGSSNAAAFRDAYAAYVRPTDGLDGITLAPFQILAAEGRSLALTESHEWHLDSSWRALDGDLITPTRHRFVDLSSREERDAATAVVARADSRRWRGNGGEAGAPDRGPDPARASRSAAASTSGSSTAPTTPTPSTCSATATSARSASSRSASTAWAWRR